MKARIRIPTKEYAFLEVDFEGTAEEIVTQHDKLQLLCNEKEGLNTHDWAKVRDTYILKGDIDPLDYEALNKWQRLVVSEIRKSFNKAKRE